MALQKIAKALLNNEIIQIYNHGNHKRDFTYIDDIVEGVAKVLEQPARANVAWKREESDPGNSSAPWSIYNIGNNRALNLITYTNTLESALGVEARKEFLPIQPGDVLNTWADVENLINEFCYSANTSVEVKVGEFAR